MKLPLQMRAVPRGSFSKTRTVGSVGRVRPSWQFVCDRVACGCSGDGSVACCDIESDCSCDANNKNAGCTGRGGGRLAGKSHLGGASGKCTDPHGHLQCDKTGDIICYAKDDHTHEACY